MLAHEDDLSPYTIHIGDCLDVLATLPADSIDTCITDPPYGLSFMSAAWDHGVPGVPFWQAVLRVLKPGAHLLAFGGTRTYHRQTVAIEDAGFEIRDCLQWLYGTGMPKSHNLSKAMDKVAGAEREIIGPNPNSRESDLLTIGPSSFTNISAPATPLARLWEGWGTGLKPAYEPVVLAMKPLDGTNVHNASKWGVAGLNIDGARIPSDGSHKRTYQPGNFARAVPVAGGSGFQPSNKEGRWPANVLLTHSPDCIEHCAPDCPVGILDGQSGHSVSSDAVRRNKALISGKYGEAFGVEKANSTGGHADSGGASRFFYTSKAGRKERELGLDGWHEKAAGFPMRSASEASTSEGGDGTKTHRATKRANIHPTVKPLAIMQYLMRLTATPTKGSVLDPFMGSGTTGMAALLEGRTFIGIEKNPEYAAIARARIKWAYNQTHPENPVHAALRARLEALYAL